uniref:Glycerophosphoryl diester phosphodiesterase membrane domain-containing protein n=1 Tax=Streptomyces sp. NBC_01401 TaxID=2903854 RepID=A0AAU3GTI5_9ACTN
MTQGPAATPDEARRTEGEHGARPGVVRTTLAVLRRDGLTLYGRAARAAGVAALGGLLVTVVAFLVTWPTFTAIRLGAIQAHIDEDSYAPDGSRVNHMWLTLLACLPFLILLLHLGCTAIQTASARAATDARGHGRFRTVLGVYALRGVCVWAPLVLGILVEEYFTTTTFREYTAIVPKWEYPHLFPLLRYGPPLLGMVLTLVLRFGWTLAPATAATEGLAPLASLRRSWSLTWGRVGAWFRTMALALPLGALAVGMYLLLHLAARPLRSASVSVFLEWGPDNTYAAYVVGLLVPIAVALLLAGALILPPAHTALAVLHRRLLTAAAPRD